MIVNISKSIICFLEEWQAWALAGGQTEGFDNRNGLCSNLLDWACREHEGKVFLLSDEFEDLQDLFYPGKAYPFGGRDVYDKEQKLGCMHKNPERLAWVELVLNSHQKWRKG